MSILDKGSVQGYAARKFLDYTYQVPILVPPGIRWNFTGFPPKLDFVDLADYEVRTVNIEDAVLYQVWMIPNKYTCAKAERKVWQIRVLKELPNFDTYYLLKEVFMHPSSNG